MRVDSHHHFWDPAHRPQAWLEEPGLWALNRRFDADDLTRLATPTGIHATVAVQSLADIDETAELLAVAARDTIVAGVVGWVDLTADVTQQVELLRSSPGGDSLVGIRHLVQDEPDPDWLLATTVIGGLRQLGAHSLVYDVLVRQPQWHVVAPLVRELDQQEFVLDHGGKPPIASGDLGEWRAWVREVAAHENVSVKLSGLVTEADHTRWTRPQIREAAHVLLEAFGPDRVMAGSDWPVCLLAASYDEVWAVVEETVAELSASEREAVLGGTATRVYSLG